MIEHDDQTMPRPPVSPPSENDPSATIQVPVELAAPPSAATTPDTTPAPAQPDITSVTTPAPAQPQTVSDAKPAITEQANMPVSAPSLPYMSVDDLLSLRIVSDPQLSPDGSQIAFTVQYNNAAQDTTGSAIYLVNSAGGKANPPRQLTSGEHHDTTPPLVTHRREPRLLKRSHRQTADLPADDERWRSTTGQRTGTGCERL